MKKLLIKLTVTQICIALFGFVTQLKLAIVFAPQEFGQMAWAVSLGIWLQVISRLGYDRTIARDIVQAEQQSIHGEIREIVDSIVSRTLLMTFFILALIIFVVLNKMAIFVAVIAISNIIVALDLYPWFDIKGATGNHIKYQIIGKIIYFSMVWIVIAFFPVVSIAEVATLLFLTAIVPIILQYYYWISCIQLSVVQIFIEIKISISNIFNIFKGRFHLVISTALSLATWRFPDLLLGSLGRLTELAGYSLMLQLLSFGLLIQDQALRLSRTTLSRSINTDEFQFNYINAFILNIALAVLVGVGISFGLYIGLNYILPSSYRWVLSLQFGLVFMTTAYALNGMWGLLLIEVHEEKLYRKGVQYGALIAVTVGSPLIYVCGAVGAQAAAVIGLFSVAVLHRINLSRISIFKKNKKNHILIYAYAEENIGDDLMLLAAKKYFCDSSITLLYSEFSDLYKSYGFETILWKQLPINLFKYDKFIVLGGSTLMDHKAAHVKAMLKILALSYFFGRKNFGVIGLNVEPFTSKVGSLIAKKIINNAGFLWVRDLFTLKFFSEIKNTTLKFNGGDPVINSHFDTYGFIKNNKLSIKNNSSIFTIGIVIHNKSQKIILDNLEILLEFLLGTGKLFSNLSINLISFQNNPTDQICIASLENDIRKIIENTTTSNIKEIIISKYRYTNNVNSIIHSVGNCDVLLAGRFHGIIIAMLIGTTVINCGYAAKFDNFLEDLGVDCNKYIKINFDRQHVFSMQERGTTYWHKARDFIESS